jgi:hypothetical protein
MDGSRTSARERLDSTQKKITVMDALVRKTETSIQELQLLLHDQTMKRDELVSLLPKLKEDAKHEIEQAACRESGDASTGALHGTSNDGTSDAPSGRPRPPGRLQLPTSLSRNSSDFFIAESPFSPPPTTALSPPPAQNRLFAGHTPNIPIAVSPHPASDPETPQPTLPFRPVVAVMKSIAPEKVEFLPRVEDDPHLEGPLTAHDDGFLDVVAEKLEAVKVEKEAEERTDSMSPIKEVAHGETLDGVVLKPTRSVNFGAPLGNLPKWM